MYKAIFIDLDGTLLNDSKTISEENVKQLNIARNQGGWEWKREAKCWALEAVTSSHPP